MKTIKRSDITEETIHVVRCPNCKEMIEESEDPSDLINIFCEHCGTDFDLED